MLPIGPFRENEDHGFTLLELLIVLTLLGIFAGILSLRVEGILTGGDLALATRRIIGTVSEFRGKAAYTGKEQTLTFNMDEGVYYALQEGEQKKTGFFGEEETGSLAERKLSLPKGVRVEDIVTPSEGKLQAGEARITFFANGCVEDSIIHLRNEKDEAYTLEINPITGQVKIHDAYIDRKSTQ